MYPPDSAGGGMESRMINRLEFRAFIKDEYDETAWESAISEVKRNLNAALKEHELLQACIYRHERMLFAYIEALTDEVDVHRLFFEMEDFLETWPSEAGTRFWAPMYPVYWQSIPKSVEEWMDDRTAGKTKVGRIAWLKQETMFDYVYWHKALTDEGLLKGDKYQFISLHENMLFSYYEEPRNNVNISGEEGESQAIGGWLAIDPGAHFDLDKSGGPHFRVLQPILIVCEV